MPSFDVKSQKILGSHEPVGGKWSIPFEYEPGDVDELEKRGKLYIVVDFVAKSDVDLHLASKIVIDAIKEHFYSELEGTPLQALESAVGYGKDKLQQTAATNNGVEIGFDIVACAVWGNILYLAQVGDTTSLIIRGGEISDVSHKTSGEVMTTSGILENEDVVILSTKRFENEFPNSDLVVKLASLEDLIASSPNSSSLSTVIISFKKSAVPSAKELASFVVPFRGKNKQSDKQIQNQQKKPVELKSDSKPDDLINSAPVTSIGGEPQENIGDKVPKPIVSDNKEKPKSDFELKPPSKRGRKTKQILKSTGILAVVGLLGFGVFMLYTNFTSREGTSDISVVVNDDLASKFELLNSSNAVVEDYVNLREEVKQQVESGGLEYYDLLSKIDEKIFQLGGVPDTNTKEPENSYYNFIAKSDNSSVNNVTSFGEQVLISDFGAKTAYLLQEGDEIGVSDIAGSENYLIATTDGNDIYVIEKDKIFVGTAPNNLVEFSLSEQVEDAFDAFVYFGNVYLLSGNKIIKLTENGDTYDVSTWYEGLGSNVNALAVDGYIYISSSNGVDKYYTGEPEDFSLATDVDLTNPILSLGLGNSLYVLSGGSLYEFNKNSGALVNDYGQIQGLPQEPKSFFVFDNSLYVSQGSSLYKISLQEDVAESNETSDEPSNETSDTDSTESQDSQQTETDE